MVTGCMNIVIEDSKVIEIRMKTRGVRTRKLEKVLSEDEFDSIHLGEKFLFDFDLDKEADISQVFDVSAIREGE